MKKGKNTSLKKEMKFGKFIIFSFSKLFSKSSFMKTITVVYSFRK